MIKFFDGNKYVKVKGVKENDAIKELNLDDNDWNMGGDWLWNSNSYVVEDIEEAVKVLKKNHKEVYSYEVY